MFWPFILTQFTSIQFSSNRFESIHVNLFRSVQFKSTLLSTSVELPLPPLPRPLYRHQSHHEKTQKHCGLENCGQKAHIASCCHHYERHSMTGEDSAMATGGNTQQRKFFKEKKNKPLVHMCAEGVLVLNLVHSFSLIVPLK